MARMIGPINTGSATGGASAASASASSNTISGQLLAIYIKYNGSPPAGTDVTISTKGTFPRPPSNTILTLTNNNTSGWYYPRQQVHDETGTGITYDGTNEVYEPVAVADHVNVKVASANNGDSVDAWLIVE